jgi:hypothetical protein
MILWNFNPCLFLIFFLLQRWNVYEPALVSYPRPDMVRKPPISFIETDSVESDLQMRAGDFGNVMSPSCIFHH